MRKHYDYIHEILDSHWFHWTYNTEEWDWFVLRWQNAQLEMGARRLRETLIQYGIISLIVVILISRFGWNLSMSIALFCVGCLALYYGIVYLLWPKIEAAKLRLKHRSVYFGDHTIYLQGIHGFVYHPAYTNPNRADRILSIDIRQVERPHLAIFFLVDDFVGTGYRKTLIPVLLPIPEGRYSEANQIVERLRSFTGPL